MGYLRSGGDAVRMSIILGHSKVSTTMKYLHLLTDDLQRPHQSLSIAIAVLPPAQAITDDP